MCDNGAAEMQKVKIKEIKRLSEAFFYFSLSEKKIDKE